MKLIFSSSQSAFTISKSFENQSKNSIYFDRSDGLSSSKFKESHSAPFLRTFKPLKSTIAESIQQNVSKLNGLSLNLNGLSFVILLFWPIYSLATEEAKFSC